MARQRKKWLLDHQFPVALSAENVDAESYDYKDGDPTTQLLVEYNIYTLHSATFHDNSRDELVQGPAADSMHAVPCTSCMHKLSGKQSG